MTMYIDMETGRTRACNRRLIIGITKMRRRFPSLHRPAFQLHSGRVRRSVADGAQLIVHLVNDNWFGRSAEPRQHELASVMRAVENRVPVVVASNTGPSEIIGPTGRVIAEGPGLFTSGFISAPVTLGVGSPYTSYGDLFAWLCVAAPRRWPSDPHLQWRFYVGGRGISCW